VAACRERHGAQRSLRRPKGELFQSARGLHGSDRQGETIKAIEMTRGARATIWILTAYKRVLSPLLPRACRFEPTCSVYALEAVRKHGLGRGLGLAARRLTRCHPFNRGGFAPVP